MEIDERMVGEIAVLGVTGSLMVGQEVRAFHERVRDLARRGNVKAVLDLGDVDYFGSSMIGQLAASKATLAELGGDIRLANVKPKLDVLLRLTGLLHTFDQFPTVDEAVSSYSAH